MGKTRLQAKIEEAAAIAESVPEPLREAAFNRAMDALMDDSADELLEEELELKDMLTPDAILGRSINTLNIARTKLGMSELDKDQIALTLATALGSITSNEKVAQVISNADELVSELKNRGQGIGGIVRPKSKKKKKGPSKKTKAEAEASTSPTQMIQELVTAGFFKTAQSAADVVLYLQQKGVDITVRQVAPALMGLMKKGSLSRRKTKAGPYVYTAKKKKK